MDYDEYIALYYLSNIASEDKGLARLVATLTWFIDGATSNEGNALGYMGSITSEDPALGNMVAGLPWFTDDITTDERLAMDALSLIALEDTDFAKTVVGLPWFTDDITADEWFGIDSLRRIASQDVELANIVVNLPWVGDDITEMDSYVLDSLAMVAAQGTDAFDQLTSQLWFADGLDQEEQALIVTLRDMASRNTNLYNDLLRTHFVQTRRVSLPLAGDVNIYVIENDPPSMRSEDILKIIEDTARFSEGFLGIPFPTTVIILQLIEIGNDHVSGFHGLHYGTYMSVALGINADLYDVIPHETAHYYFYSDFGAAWMYEGMAEFIESYFNDRTGVQSMADRKTEVLESVRDNCADRENIRHSEWLLEHVYNPIFGPGGCTYSMGENFLIGIFDTIGEKAMSAALHELYLLNSEYWRNLESGQIATEFTEEVIYNSFMEHAPADKKDALRNLYQTLHGGAFAFDDVDFDDDHGDEVELATEIVAGDVVDGSLDYMFDFDYFAFQTEKDRKYRITVNHESLGASGVTLYDTDGLTRGRWKSLTQEASGPQLQWVAPSSDKYYFAVQNFGGKTGAYTLTITAVAPLNDDHGDTIATATNISLGETVQGTVDGDFDYDYFQFQAVEGKNYRVEIDLGTLEYYHRHLYTADGVPHDYGYESWDDGVRASSTETVDWTPSSSGTFYLAIDGAWGSVGSYTVTITPVDDGGS